MASLADGAKHGYAIMEDVETLTGVHLGPGTLYGALARLEKRGWIEPLESTARRRPYRLTASGHTLLKEHRPALGHLSLLGSKGWQHHK